MKYLGVEKRRGKLPKYLKMSELPLLSGRSVLQAEALSALPSKAKVLHLFFNAASEMLILLISTNFGSTLPLDYIKQKDFFPL